MSLNVAMPVSVAPLPGRELARLRALSRELSAALADMHDASSPEPGSRGARALARLVRGDGRPQDELVLGVVVPQSRLLSVSVPQPRHGQILISDIGADGRVVGLRHSETEVLFLVPDLPSRDGASRSREAAERVARRVTALVSSATIGISSPLQGVHELPTALEEARRVDRFGEAFAFADDRWAQLGVTRLADELGRCLTLSNPLSRLVQNEMLAESVAAWLEHGRNVPTAAAALDVHPNTLRYRLNRVLDVTGLDLSDPDAMLLTQLVLRRRTSV
jgi:DNA-binding PucR family transcriptional regulator